MEHSFLECIKDIKHEVLKGRRLLLAAVELGSAHSLVELPKLIVVARGTRLEGLRLWTGIVAVLDQLLAPLAQVVVLLFLLSLHVDNLAIVADLLELLLLSQRRFLPLLSPSG